MPRLPHVLRRLQPNAPRLKDRLFSIHYIENKRFLKFSEIIIGKRIINFTPICHDRE